PVEATVSEPIRGPPTPSSRRSMLCPALAAGHPRLAWKLAAPVAKLTAAYFIQSPLSSQPTTPPTAVTPDMASKLSAWMMLKASRAGLWPTVMLWARVLLDSFDSTMAFWSSTNAEIVWVPFGTKNEEPLVPMTMEAPAARELTT